MDDFKGRIVHPQTWPEDLDYKGKKVVVIGSGATAATLVPAIADDCAHVTMLQRSPTYLHPGAQRQRPRRPAAPARGRRILDPRDRAAQDPARSGRLHPPLLRGAGQGEGRSCWPACAPISGPTTTSPRISRRATGRGASASPSCRTATCSRGIARGKASVVTDEIERFTEKGILLKSGKELEADIVVTATGFHLSVLGDIDVRDRRQAARLLADRHLSRHDVHRRAQHGLGVRLFPRQLDAARRPRRRFRLPPAQPHEGRSRRARSRSRCGPRTGTCRCCPGSIPRTSIPAT